MNTHRSKQRRRFGATLMDVVAGSMLMSTLLIPMAHVINESNANTHRLNVRESLLADAQQVIEQTKIAMSEPSYFDSAYSRGVDTLNKQATTYGTHSVARTRIEPNKNVSPARLATILVDVWHDDDGDGILDAGEPVSSLRTQIAAPERK